MINIAAILLSILSASNGIQLTMEQQYSILDEAQVAYDQGIALQTADPVASKEAFRRSANRFKILVDDGIENGMLWYDLGNAQLQAGEVGEAIAAYRSAKRYLPSNGRVSANLDYARSLVINPMNLEDTPSILKRLAFWHESLPTQIRLYLGIILWFTFWALISVRIFRVIPGFKTSAIVTGLSALALCISVSADIADQRQSHGVLTAQEVIVRKGNGTNYEAMFQEPLHEGIEFEIVGNRRDWLHIRLPNGSEGWIEKKDAQIVTLEIKEGERI